MDSTGRYRCEVSAEAPNFDTVNSKGTMVVVGEFWADYWVPMGWVHMEDQVWSVSSDSSYVVVSVE